MQQILRKAMWPAVAALAIGVATPALSADYFPREPAPRAAVMVPAGPLTLQDALRVAAGIGVTTVQNTHFDGDEWEIEGRDSYGKWIQVDVDARTGEVRNVDRSII
jgi:hypothetical protein